MSEHNQLLRKAPSGAADSQSNFVPPARGFGSPAVMTMPQVEAPTIAPAELEQMETTQAPEVAAPFRGHDFSKISILPKLTVGAPDDPLEREADRVAEQVMRMPDMRRGVSPGMRALQMRSQARDDFGNRSQPNLAMAVQRKCAACDEEELQRKAGSDDGGFEASGDLESRLNSSKGGGSPLSDEVRSFMEPRMGADFSEVRVHTGSEAVQMSRELNAQAFAHGQDIYFGAGKAPGKDALTAHELTHVVQQSGGVQTKQTKTIRPSIQPFTVAAPSSVIHLKHLTIPEAVQSFTDVVKPSNETPDSPTITETGQFYWTQQIRFAISQRIGVLRFIPAAKEWQELLNDLDAASDMWSDTAPSSKAIKKKISSIRKRAKDNDVDALSLLPVLPAVETLLHPAPASGKAIYYSLWAQLNKGDQVPALTRYESIPTLKAVWEWENQACGFTGSIVANRYVRKEKAKDIDQRANPDAERKKSTAVWATLAGSATRDMRPTSGFRLGDVLNQNGVAAVVPKMQIALDDGWILHARVLSGVDYGHGDATAHFDKLEAKGKAPKQPQRIGKPPEEHSIMIIGYDANSNEFVFWDPDSGSSNKHGAGFGSLFFSGSHLSSASNDADLAVDNDGNHRGGSEHRYQVITISSQ
jgi:hypothetical protein